MPLQLDSKLQTPRLRLPALRRCSADRRRNKRIGCAGARWRGRTHERPPNPSRKPDDPTHGSARSVQASVTGWSLTCPASPPCTNTPLHACTSTSLSTSHDINSLSVASSSVPDQRTPFSCARTPIYSKELAACIAPQGNVKSTWFLCLEAGGKRALGTQAEFVRGQMGCSSQHKWRLVCLARSSFHIGVLWSSLTICTIFV